MVQIGQTYKVKNRNIYLTITKAGTDPEMWITDISDPSQINIQYFVDKGDYILVGGPGFCESPIKTETIAKPIFSCIECHTPNEYIDQPNHKDGYLCYTCRKDYGWKYY